MDCTTPISDGNELKWAGFSNKGLLYIQETNNTVHTLISQCLWTPVFRSTSSIWIRSIVGEGDLYAVSLPYGELEPNPLAELQPRKMALKLLMHPQNYHDMAKTIVQKGQIQFQTRNWGHMKDCAIVDPSEDTKRSNMPDNSDAALLSIKNDKTKVNLIRIAAQEGRFSDVVWLSCQIENEHILTAACTLLTKIGKSSLSERV